MGENNPETKIPSTDADLIVPTPQGVNHKKRVYYIIAGFIIVLLFAGAIFLLVFYNKTPSNSLSDTSTQTTSGSSPAPVSQVPTVDNDRAMVMQSSKIAFSDIASEATSSYQSMPLLVQDLANTGVTSLTVKSLIYTDGRTGIEAEFQDQGNITDEYFSFIKLASSQKFAFLDGKRTDIFALAEVNNEQQFIRFTETATGENIFDIIIQTVNNTAK